MKLDLKSKKGTEHCNITIKSFKELDDEITKFAKKQETEHVDFILKGRYFFKYEIKSMGLKTGE